MLKSFFSITDFTTPVQNGRSGEWFIDDVVVDEFVSARSKMSRNSLDWVEAGTYKRLVRVCSNGHHEVVMSNTRMEFLTNKDFVIKANGKILINGLGLGLIVNALLKKESVESITIIEKSQDVINLVSPYFNDQRLKIINCDAMLYKPNKDDFFDYVYHDIWPSIDPENIESMKKLHRKYGRKCENQSSWCRSDCERMR